MTATALPLTLRRKLRRLRWKIAKYLPTRHRLRRVFRQRCDECGYRGRWNESWHTYGNRYGKVWHGKCIELDQSRMAANERLAVLDLICEVWEVDSRAVQQIAELRGQTTPDEASQANRAWRVMYALQNLRAKDMA